MGEHGQSSDPTSPAYISLGLPLVTNVIELVTAESSAPGQRHAQLSGHIGEIAVHTWAAGTPGFPGGVKWILAADWLPYQRSTFVTPAFPGYVSGHSAFSRAAAEVLVRITGSAYFPGGLGSFTASSNQFLQFDIGPSTDVTLQWATYYDASDQAGQSRIYGGIHYPADDSAGRIMGSQCGIGAWNLATHYFDGSIANIPFAVRFQPAPSGAFNLNWDATRGAYYKVQQADDLLTGIFTDLGDWIWAGETLETLQLPAPPTPSSQKFYRVIRAYNH
jgi:hypothetical protein